ncbi:MAG TPA: 3'-5' exonuclease [Bryobacteraceae bacterium]|nr:3'-5' exonuclease [Bryobacteraceae bacterium]
MQDSAEIWGLYGRQQKSFLISTALQSAAVGLIFLAFSSPKVQDKVRQVATLVMPADLAPSALDRKPRENHGGGGGGDRSPVPASKGRLPKAALRQFVPPAAVLANPAPKLAMEPSILVPPDVNLLSVNLANSGIAAVIDAETTGLSLGDELIEIGTFSFEWSTGRVLECLGAYEGPREPRVPIHPEAIRKHKITLAELHGEGLDNTRIEELLLRAEFILAHNSNFDHRFVAKSLVRMPASCWFSTMEGIQWFEYGFDSRKLAQPAHAHSIGRGRAHSAVDDALTTLILVGRHGKLDRSMYLLEILKRAAKQQKKRAKTGVLDLQRRVDLTCHFCGASIYQTVGWFIKQRKGLPAVLPSPSSR